MPAFEGKRVIVFGGSGSVGRAICRSLVEDGARVAFSYFQNAELAGSLQRELPGSISLRLDLAATAEIAPALSALRAELGGLDALVHAATLTSAAAEPHFERITEVDEAAFDRLLSVNLKSAFFACRALANGFQGNIVLLGSIDGVKAVPAPAAYATSKGALSALARTLGKELGPKGVRVNVVAPGVLQEGSSRTLPDELRAEYLKHCGLRRLGRVQEVAGLVSWFALRNSYITGQTLIVDGAL